jgi:hypothetical protein
MVTTGTIRPKYLRRFYFYFQPLFCGCCIFVSKDYSDLRSKEIFPTKYTKKKVGPKLIFIGTSIFFGNFFLELSFIQCDSPGVFLLI